MAELRRGEITKRIKQARVESGLTQPEIAALLDVGLRTYQNYEADRVPWNLIDKIAEATGKTSEWLLHGETATPELLAKVSSGAQVDAGFIEFRHHVDEMNAKLDANQELLAALLRELAPAEFANYLERLEDQPAPAGEQPSERARDQDDQDSAETG